MLKTFYGFLISLVSCLAYAQEERAADAPAATADPIIVILFGVLFFGGIAYFGWLVWRNERRSKSDGGKS
jgi:hypothetical protein